MKSSRFDSTTAHPLIVWLPNWLGDCVMLYPALEALSKLGFSLRLIGPSWTQAVYTREDWRYATKPTRYLQQIKLLRSWQEKDMVVITNSLSSALVGFMAHKKTVGYASDGRRVLLDKAIKKVANLHEVVYFFDLAMAAAQFYKPEVLPITKLPVDFCLPVTTAAKDVAIQLLQKNKINRAYCVLCPAAMGSGEGQASKVWPHWSELAVHLQAHNIACLVCPGPQDKMPDLPGVVNLAGVGLAEYKALLAQASCVIANDTGPMHLAAAVGAPTLGVFGVSDPARTHPWQGHYVGSRGAWPSLAAVVECVGTYLAIHEP